MLDPGEMQVTLQELEESAKQAFGSNPSASSDEASGMLALLNVAGTLQACMAGVETLLRDNLGHVRALLRPQARQQDLFSLVHVRLEKAEVGGLSPSLVCNTYLYLWMIALQHSA